MITRDLFDPVVAEVQKSTGIPAANVLVHCTHTHHAPSTINVYAYGREDVFCRTVQRAIVKAVQDANGGLSAEPCRFFFQAGKEETLGQNSRVLLADGMVYWVGPQDGFVRPTGPFDPELPVLAFRHTYVAELSNDWIGYLPDLTCHKLGGYQVWTGLHSYAEAGTGERLVDEAVVMLRDLQANLPSLPEY